ncbi:MAG: hypothetical protein U0Y68_07330 [Blastocatellia bacterium]
MSWTFKLFARAARLADYKDGQTLPLSENLFDLLSTAGTQPLSHTALAHEYFWGELLARRRRISTACAKSNCCQWHCRRCAGAAGTGCNLADFGADDNGRSIENPPYARSFSYTRKSRQFAFLSERCATCYKHARHNCWHTTDPRNNASTYPLPEKRGVVFRRHEFKL